jgi:hypothetical protein
MSRDVDFHHIPVNQAEIHVRLLNWARWCRGKPGSHTSPMFRGYRATDVWAAPEIGEPVNVLDAAKVAKAVIALPEKHRDATQWHYVHPVAPGRACRALAVSYEGLARLVIDARTMLVNRKA